ncbi:cytidylate kinase family protein [candidate division KSB1 bacterium]|nr:cytidylate kinase family protein [candidate division KSB1 bacterium]
MSDDKFSWISKFDKPNLHWLLAGIILLLVGGSKILSYSKGSFTIDDNYRIAVMVAGGVCLGVSLILTLKSNPKEISDTSEKNATSTTHLDLSVARDHLLNEVLPEYRRKTPLTLSDKKDSMAAILRMISLTTIPSTKENLARMGLFEVMESGRFRILAAHHIDAHRLLKLENLFSHNKKNPKGAIGYSVANKKNVKINDLDNPPEEFKGLYEVTDDNKLPAQKAKSILIIPIFRNPNIQNPETLAALSATTSVKDYFTEEHEKELIEYVNIIRNFLDHFETNISFNPSSKQKIRIITISGQSGSGKTTLAEKLHFHLKFAKWTYVVIGDLFRDFCAKNNIDIDRNTENIPDHIHKKFDIFQQELLSQEENLIVEGRMSGYWANQLNLKDVYKIYCDLPLDERVSRVIKRVKEKGGSIRDAKKIVTERDSKDINTYRNLYQIQDYRKKEYYDLYLDMHPNTNELTETVFRELQK